MFEKLLRIFNKIITTAERDRLLSKFDALECRMDKLEIFQVEIQAEIRTLSQIWLANSELLEGKLNLSRVNQEMIKDMIDTKFGLIDRSFSDVKELIKTAR